MSEKTVVEYLEWIKMRSWNVDFMNTNDLRKFFGYCNRKNKNTTI